jgi:hypothetical protein
MNLPISLISLILINIYFYYELLIGKIDIFEIIILYCLESIVVIFFTAIKIFILPINKFNINTISKTSNTFFKLIKFFLYKIFYVLKFLIIYCVVLSLYFAMLVISFDNPSLNTLHKLIPYSTLFVLSHGFSFFYNFLYKKEYQYANSYNLSRLPINRLLTLHVVVVLGTLLANKNTNIFFFSTIFVLLKTTVDIIKHLNERNAFRNPVNI